MYCAFSRRESLSRVTAFCITFGGISCVSIKGPSKTACFLLILLKMLAAHIFTLMLSCCMSPCHTFKEYFGFRSPIFMHPWPSSKSTFSFSSSIHSISLSNHHKLLCINFWITHYPNILSIDSLGKTPSRAHYRNLSHAVGSFSSSLDLVIINIHEEILIV